MSTQDVTLGVALIGFLGTLSVQLINFFSTTYSKAIDERQKQEDRKQELRKVYLNRKLEAGEIAISRATAMVQQLHLLHEHFSTIDVSDYNDEYNAARHQEIQEQQKLINAGIMAEKNFGLLYYARVLDYDTIEQKVLRHNKLLVLLNYAGNELSYLGSLLREADGSDSEEAIRQDILNKGDKTADIMAEYLACNSEARQLILKSCDEIRQQMSQYELP